MFCGAACFPPPRSGRRCWGTDRKISQITIENIRRGTLTQTRKGGRKSVSFCSHGLERWLAKCSFKTAWTLKWWWLLLLPLSTLIHIPMPFPLLLNGSPIEYSITMAFSGLEDGAGTHKNKLPLSAELQNTLEERNGRHDKFLYGGGI